MGFVSVKGPSVQQQQTQQIADLNKRLADYKKILETQSARGPGYQALDRNKYEQAADVTPPGYEGIRDIKTGKLLSDFTFNPFKGEASKRLRDESLSTELSPLAKAQIDRQRVEEATARSNLGLKTQAENSNAISNLMRTGGINTGARTSLARSSARDALNAKQNLANEGIMSRMKINEDDMNYRKNLLNQTADLERGADTTNMNALKDEIARRSEFDTNRYNQQMAAWGAEKTADATRASGGGGGCFDPDAMISMENGSEKKISEIVCGDDILAGGKVLSTHVFYGDFELFSYCGALLTGDHAVYEKSKWVRVQDSDKAKKTGIFVSEVRNLVTKNHVIICCDTVFSDNVETDENYADERLSLMALNGEV